MSEDIKTYERVFNIVGWVGFIFVLPLVLASFGSAALLNNLSTSFGVWGSTGLLLVYFYAFQALRIFFGSGRFITPLLVGGVLSFLLLSAVVQIGFMTWWRDLLKPTLCFAGNPFALVGALVSIAFGYILSSLHTDRGSAFGRWFLIVLLVIIVPVALAVVTGLTHLPQTLGVAAIQ